MLSDRQKKILKWIVEEHVRTVEPVGSKVMSEMPEFNYSSATIRNDMAYLEELGLLAKMHTSSGRVPSEAGYKMYVSMMLEEDKNRSQEMEFPMIDEIFRKNAFNQEEAIRESMALVSELTNYASVVLGTNALDAKIRKIQLVNLSNNCAVIILVTDQGYVESKKIIIPENINYRDIEKIVGILNDSLYDCPIVDIDKRLKENLHNDQVNERIQYYDELLSIFVRTITNMVQDQYYMAGQNNIMNQPEFQDINKLKNVIKVMEEKEILKFINLNSNEITVRIGADNELSAMKDCTLISVPYRDNEGSRGAIAIIGPKRMEYQKVIPLLEYIAKNMHKL